MSIFAKIASLGVGELMTGAGKLAKDLREAFTGDISADKKAELLDKAAELDLVLDKLAVHVTELQSQVIIAEAQGESWLQRNWRPLLMCTFGVIIANNYIIAPYIGLFMGPEYKMVLEIPPNMWGLLKIGVGGYIVGRSAEHLADKGGMKAMMGNLMGK
jgi:hypothetical protein